jgi:crotonobetainyl-CoA:carnitine CoA-transferase CaiB-like acyl-CoA transferase
MTDATTSAAPLAGIVVLDLTRLLPGNYCTWLLRSLGAEVIKVEDPFRGDYQREFPPRLDGVGVMYQMLNRGKSSIALDLKDAEGAATFQRIVETRADVVIESFRPGVMNRLGVGAERLRELKPNLVYVAVSGYGATGPLSSTPGHDVNYLAEAGFLYDGSTADSVAWADVIGGGLIPALGVCALLNQARASGVGATLDAAMFEGLALLPRAALVEAVLRQHSRSGGSELVVQADGAPSLPYYGIYELVDGRVAVGAVEDKFWRNFCDAMNLTRYRESQHDEALAGEIITAVAREFERLTRKQVADRFTDVDACVAVVRDAGDLLEGALSGQRQWVREVTDDLPIVGSPFVVDGQRAFSEGPAPTLGQHTTEVLRDSGFSEAEVAALLARGVVRGS